MELDSQNNVNPVRQWGYLHPCACMYAFASVLYKCECVYISASLCLGVRAHNVQRRLM